MNDEIPLLGTQDAIFWAIGYVQYRRWLLNGKKRELENYFTSRLAREWWQKGVEAAREPNEE